MRNSQDSPVPLQISGQVATTKVLSNCSYVVHDIGYPAFPTSPKHTVPSLCFPIRGLTDFVSLNHCINILDFPSGEVTYTFRTQGNISRHAYCHRSGLLAYAATHEKRNRPGSEYIALGQVMEGSRPRRLGRIPRVEEVHSLALWGDQFLAIGHHHFSDVYRIGLSEPNLRLNYPQCEDAIESSFVTDNILLSATSEGLIYKWDLRAPGAPVWASKKSRETISHFQVGSDEVSLYISRITNSANALTAWDMRTGGLLSPNNSSPLLVFHGNKNPRPEVYHFGGGGYEMRFDIEEGATGGVLAAPGHDGFVRLWDCNQGGFPIGMLPLHDGLRDNEGLCEVKFVGWDRYRNGWSPGLWVRSELVYFVCHTPPSDDRSSTYTFV